MPSTTTELAEWFREGVQKELDYLESNSGSQKFELLSGQLAEKFSDSKQAYQFLLADEARIPEDSIGQLRIGDNEYRVSIISQVGTKVIILIDADCNFGNTIPRAILTADDTMLVKRLVDILTDVSTNNEHLSDFAAKVFNPLNEKRGVTEIPQEPEFDILRNSDQLEHKKAIETSMGSPVTYVWGPPGTGKTFTISYLIALSIALGKRVLVASHTNAAIDQIIFESTKRNNSLAGPLLKYVTDSFQETIIRLGQTVDKKVPDNVCLDTIVERKNDEIKTEIECLNNELAALTKVIVELQKNVKELEDVEFKKSMLEKMRLEAKHLNRQKSKLQNAIDTINNYLYKLSSDYKKAEKAWLFREKKKEAIMLQYNEAKGDLAKTEKEIEANGIKLKELFDKIRKKKNDINQVEEKLAYLPSIELGKSEISKKQKEAKDIKMSINELNNKLAKIQTEVINNARVIFCTLTKIYTNADLKDQEFDVVIVDEISMAMPPLIFLASGKATTKVILVGDFLQLPPIVKSDNELSKQRLERDAFSLSGLIDESNLSLKDDAKCVVKLGAQRRMAPPIAEVARKYVYRQANFDLRDHESVIKVDSKDWMSFLPDDSIVIVDTADLNCWCGKQPIGLSRFNFYSAFVAVEIAAIASKNIPQYDVNETQPIGIITPYAAQKKIIAKLIKDLKLENWVNVGTVHTFQGAEAELIIFDSVLDNPYWSAMMVTPKHMQRVKRELNVAITRAKNRFVFIGSSSWLNDNSKINSGLGLFWDIIKESAPLISVFELVEKESLASYISEPSKEEGWQVPLSSDEEMIIPLDEGAFFDYFIKDINSSKESIFALAPYFGQYRWPKIQPYFYNALNRGVEVVLIIPPVQEASNPAYVKEVVNNMRSNGAIVFYSSGLHGKDIIIDNKIMYTGSMNWSSNRGLNETSHRVVSADYINSYLELLQVKYIREAGSNITGQERKCPKCGASVQIVNQRKQNGLWDKQPLKIGCTDNICRSYLRDINERPPFISIPVCENDSVTKYRRVPFRRTNYWQCPKHPKKCQMYKVVPGDPE